MVQKHEMSQLFSCFPERQKEGTIGAIGKVVYISHMPSTVVSF